MPDCWGVWTTSKSHLGKLFELTLNSSVSSMGRQVLADKSSRVDPAAVFCGHRDVPRPPRTRHRKHQCNAASENQTEGAQIQPSFHLEPRRPRRTFRNGWAGRSPCRSADCATGPGFAAANNRACRQTGRGNPAAFQSNSRSDSNEFRTLSAKWRHGDLAAVFCGHRDCPPTPRPCLNTTLLSHIECFITLLRFPYSFNFTL